MQFRTGGGASAAHNQVLSFIKTRDAPDQQLDEHDFDGSEALLQASGFRFLGLAAGEAQ